MSCIYLYNKQFLMVNILSKGTWLLSFALNLSANDCFSTFFSFVDLLYYRWGEVGVFQGAHSVGWVLPPLFAMWRARVPRHCTGAGLRPLFKLLLILMLWRPQTLTFVLSTMQSITAATGILLGCALNSTKVQNQIFMCYHVHILFTE